MKLKPPTAAQVLKFAATALLPLALLAACSSAPPVPTSPPLAPSAYDSGTGFGGEIVTDSSATTATIVSVDRARRLVVVKRADGRNVTYKAAANAFAFDDLKAGDVVKLTVAEELAVFLGKNSVPGSAHANTAKLRVRLPSGTQAVVTEVAALTFTARIIALDDWNDTVTLQLADGRMKTIKVGQAVNLADVSVGDHVSVQATEAAVLVLEKP
jgi:hypothetical protein